ncbi:MAG: DUF4389 domain-containing protein [Candidatus Heimdallarchaeota archaeon]
MASLPPFVETASRVNFCLVRPLLQILYGFVYGFVLFIYGILIGFTSFINCLTVLFAGKRFRAHYDFTLKLAKWIGHISMYFGAATDDVPDFFP